MDLPGAGSTQGVNRVKVFVASPGDLSGERDRAEAVLSVLHKVIDVQVEPIRWETDMPGGSVSTPTIQDEIDKLLTGCQVVLVLFYSKVGNFTPRELALALNLSKKVFVYFKTGFSPGNLDESERFTEVLKLKKAIENESRILFKEFDSIDRFENILKNDMPVYLKSQYPSLPPGKTDFETFMEETQKIEINRQCSTSDPVAGKEFSDLDQARVRDFLNQERVIVEFLEKEIATPEGKFSYFHLMIEPGYLVKGAYLCFGKNIPGVCRTASPTKFIVYETEDISKPGINIAVDGHLLEQYFTILGHLKKNLYLIRDVYTREPEDYEIPLAVIMELLANAYVHRDYGDNILSNIQVELHPDRLEILNPGNFPAEISLDHPEEIDISLQRNIEISKVFFLYGIAERIGKGISRIQDELKKRGLAPAIFDQNQKLNRVKVTVKKKTFNAAQNTSKSGPVSLTHLPPRLGAFIGREDELARLKAQLEKQAPVLLVQGLGGIGKTELCKAFLWAHYDDYRLIGWIDYSGSLKSSFVNQFQVHGLDIPEIGTVDERFAPINRYLAGLDKETLLVVDNIDNPDDPDLSLLAALRCRVLANSRSRVEGFFIFELEFLPKQACRELFYLYYRAQDKEKEIEALDRLLDRAGCHTLTVELLARTAQAAGLTALDLEKKLTEIGFNLDGIIKENIATQWGNDKQKHQFFAHLGRVFDLSKLSKKEKTVLANMSLLPALPVEVAELKDWLGLESADVLNGLVDKGWLKRAGNGLEMHLVIGEVVRHKEKPTAEKCKKLIQSLARKLYIEPGDNPLDKKGYVVYAQAVVDRLSDDDEDLATLANNLSLRFQDLGRLDKALEFQQKAQAIREKVLGTDHPDLATSYNNLSSVYQSLGQFDRALAFQHKALAIREKVLSPDHPGLAASYNNLSMIYQTLGQLDRSLEFQLKAVEISEMALGPDHPSLATSYNNLSTIYQDLGQLDRALEFQLKTSEIFEKVLGPDHPSLATSYNNLSIIYRSLGQLDRALEFQLRDVNISEKIFGPDHPDLAVSYNNLSEIYRDLGQLDRALDYSRRAVAILEKLFPSGHPNLDIMKKNLAGIEAMVGRPKKKSRQE